MDNLVIYRSIACLNLFKISRKTSPFLCSLSVLLVGNTNMVGHVNHIPRMHCLGDHCAIWCYTNRLSRVLRISWILLYTRPETCTLCMWISPSRASNTLCMHTYIYGFTPIVWIVDEKILIYIHINCTNRSTGLQFIIYSIKIENKLFGSIISQ